MLRRSFLQSLFALTTERSERIRKAVEAGSSDVRSWTLHVHQGKDLIEWTGGSGPTPADGRVYLLASITKPMTATGLMVLADRGQLKLTDRVRKFIPEFKGGDRDMITIRHLLTHTSGLPDMLPENEALRKKHAPLSEFVAGACRTPLLFKPGTECKYQSMGILLAAEIAERITKQRFREFLRANVFEKLGMKHAALGLGSFKIPETEQSQVTGDDDWNWNSPYWRDLGAPWGGAHATAADVRRFLECFLEPDSRVLKPETARAMVTDHNASLNEPWGIGWMVNGAKFSRHCSPRTFGHWGSTGTVCWLDPKSRASMVLLTTKPANESRAAMLGPVSDAVAEATA